ncbi:unnamed protein product, partial [Darwinula stevensoni]
FNNVGFSDGAGKPGKPGTSGSGGIPGIPGNLPPGMPKPPSQGGGGKPAPSGGGGDSAPWGGGGKPVPSGGGGDSAPWGGGGKPVPSGGSAKQAQSLENDNVDLSVNPLRSAYKAGIKRQLYELSATQAVFNYLDMATSAENFRFNAFREAAEKRRNLPFLTSPTVAVQDSPRQPELVETVRELMDENFQVTTQELDEGLGVGESTVHDVLTQDLQLRNVASIWIPHQLTEDSKAARINGAKHVQAFFSAKAWRLSATSSTRPFAASLFRVTGSGRNAKFEQNDASPKERVYPECKLTNMGKEYMGEIDETETGKACLRWDSQPYGKPEDFMLDTPYEWHFLNLNVSIHENHCRNPGMRERPWCFVSDQQIQWEYCQIPFCSDMEPRECKLTTLGGEYMGRKNVTKSGRPCQPWSSQQPNTHDRLKFRSAFPDAGKEMELNHNFCRNPDAEFEGPWCYNGDSIDPRWEYCDVPPC